MKYKRLAAAVLAAALCLGHAFHFLYLAHGNKTA